MAPVIVKPENAIKRAEELINVGQASAALQQLHEAMVSKKYRTYSDAHEHLMMRLIELSVELRKGRQAREALHAFKNICLNHSVNALENVVEYFIELTENKAKDAQKMADKVAIDHIVEDLDQVETPESIMLSTLSGGDSTKTAADVVTPWLKFLWETYRTLLDVLKYNSKLEPLYQQCAHKAFDFCLNYRRKTEMKRLCELLRNHLVSISKYSQQPYAITLSQPESLQMHLDTRFIQLNACTQLELWQEAFRTVEDIHSLVSLAKGRTLIKPIMTINFFEQITKIFMVAGNFLFHAASWNKFYVASMANKTLVDVERMSSMVLLSALAIPITSSIAREDQVEMDHETFRMQSLIHYLNLSEIPTRSQLIQDALDRGLLNMVASDVKELYNCLEVDFNPMKIMQKLEPICKSLARDCEMQKYVRQLFQVALSKMLLQLSQVYSSIKLQSLHQLAHIPEPYSMSSGEIETFLLLKCRLGELPPININHRLGIVEFNSQLLSHDNHTMSLQPSLSHQLCQELKEFGNVLSTSINIDNNNNNNNLKQLINNQRSNLLNRIQVIEKKKELLESILTKKEREEARDRALKAQMEAEAERVRLAEEARKRELERLKREREEIERQQAQKLAEEIKKKNVRIQAEDLENLDREKLLQMQCEQLESEKRALDIKLSNLAKRIDHTERAYRIEEIPLIKKSYQQQKALDKEAHDNAYKLLCEATKRQHELDVAARDRLMRLKQEHQEYKQRLLKANEDAMKSLREEAERNLQKAKEKYIQDLKQKRKEEVLREKYMEAKEEERKRKEEDEKKSAKYRPPIGASRMTSTNINSGGDSKQPSSSSSSSSGLPNKSDNPWRISSGRSGNSSPKPPPPSSESSSSTGDNKYVPPWKRK